MPDEHAVGHRLEDFFQARQARLVGVADVVEMKQHGQLRLGAGLHQGDVSRVVNRHARLVFAETFGPGVDVPLENVNLAAMIQFTGAGIDRETACKRPMSSP